MAGFNESKILIIDDNEQDQKLIKKLLAREGILEVFTSNTGIDGIFSAEENAPDIILIDTQMPGLDGFETCKKIKSSKKIDAKVIIMTGAIEAVDATKARESGADGYCAKTRDCEKLIVTVKQLLNS